jgi:hypothetical protein
MSWELPVLDFRLDVIDRIKQLDFEEDHLPGESLDENLRHHGGRGLEDFVS